MLQSYHAWYIFRWDALSHSILGLYIFAYLKSLAAPESLDISQSCCSGAYMTNARGWIVHNDAYLEVAWLIKGYFKVTRNITGMPWKRKYGCHRTTRFVSSPCSLSLTKSAVQNHVQDRYKIRILYWRSIECIVAMKMSFISQSLYYYVSDKDPQMTINNSSMQATV